LFIIINFSEIKTSYLTPQSCDVNRDSVFKKTCRPTAAQNARSHVFYFEKTIKRKNIRIVSKAT